MKYLSILFMFLTFHCIGQEWVSLETPVEENLILFDIVFPAGQNEIGYACGADKTYKGQGTILKTSDGGDTWEIQWASSEDDSGLTSAYFFSTNIGMMGRMDGSIMSTLDGGLNWTIVDIDSAVDQGEIRDIQFIDDQNGAITTAWEGIYLTADSGATWTQATTNYIGAQSIAYADASNIFGCGNNQKIYHSSDGGINWSEIYEGPNGPMLWVNIGIQFFDAQHGMVTSEEGQIFITDDGGQSWSVGQVENQFGLMHGIWYNTKDEIYIAATPGSVYKSVDAGLTWLLDSPVDFDPSYYKILFTENGTGFVSGSGPTGGTILRKSPIANKLTESEIVALIVGPNPTSDRLHIEANFPCLGASFRIFDMAGKLVYSGELISNDISLSHLSGGQYNIFIESKDGKINGASFILTK